MNEKAMLYIILFFFLGIMSRVAANWIMDEVYSSAGVKTEDVLKKRAEYRHRKRPHKWLTGWLISVSPQPRKTRKLLNIHLSITLAPVICMALSVMGLFSHIFDNILDFASMAVTALILLTVLFGIIYGNFKR